MMRVTLPIETKVRELEGKLWLALHLAREGCEVYLGPDTAIGDNLLRLRPDIHLLNSGYAAPTYLAAVNAVKSYGGRIAILDTEGGLYRSRDAYATRVSPEIVSRADFFLAWGPDPASIVEETMRGAGAQVVVTGNPTFDLLHAPADDVFSAAAAELRREFGRYVMINTNFGYANPFSRRTVDQRTETPLRREMEELLLQRVIELATTLADRYPDTNFILRPHPSEDHEFYRKKFGSRANLHVLHRGPVAPWLKGCAALVHNTCTTGVEASLLGKPVFAYCPTPYHMEEFSVANAVSERIEDRDEIVARVGECLIATDDGRLSLPSDRKAALERYIANVDFSATERITKLFLAVGPAGSRPRGRIPARARLHAAILAVGGERALDAFRVMKNKGDRTWLTYVRQKFPGLAVAEVEARARRYAAVDPSLGDVIVEKVRGVEHTLVVRPRRLSQ